jgi:hypothetical protein
VPALQAKVTGIRADGFGHTQPIQGGQGHQRVFERRMPLEVEEVRPEEISGGRA